MRLNMFSLLIFAFFSTNAFSSDGLKDLNPAYKDSGIKTVTVKESKLATVYYNNIADLYFKKSQTSQWKNLVPLMMTIQE